MKTSTVKTPLSTSVLRSLLLVTVVSVIVITAAALSLTLEAIINPQLQVLELKVDKLSDNIDNWFKTAYMTLDTLVGGLRASPEMTNAEYMAFLKDHHETSQFNEHMSSVY